MSRRRIESKADPGYWRAFGELMSRIEASLGAYKGPAVPVYIAGGAASHIYTGSRLSLRPLLAVDWRIVHRQDWPLFA